MNFRGRRWSLTIGEDIRRGLYRRKNTKPYEGKEEKDNTSAAEHKVVGSGFPLGGNVQA
jgi:hypothetical protein